MSIKLPRTQVGNRKFVFQQHFTAVANATNGDKRQGKTAEKTGSGGKGALRGNTAEVLLEKRRGGFDMGHPQ